MYMALSTDEWLSLNTQYCNRYRALISPATCAKNRQAEDGSRCVGCGGLEDQVREPERQAPVLVYSKPEPERRSIDPLTRALVIALQEVLDGDEWLGEELADDLVDDDDDGLDATKPQCTSPENAATAELDPLMQLLMAGLQEYDEEDRREPEAARVEIREPAERKRRVRVYVGRCMKCGGYMAHAAKECHDGMTDDEVYRCFNCGWRISPAYDYNRKHPGE